MFACKMGVDCILLVQASSGLTGDVGSKQVPNRIPRSNLNGHDIASSFTCKDGSLTFPNRRKTAGLP